MSDDLQGSVRDVVSARESWQKQCSVAPLDLLESQRKWDDLLCEVALNDLLVDVDQWDRCRLLAAKSAHSAAWSEAVAFETTGCCGPSTSSFVEKLGRKVIEVSGDPLKAVWLRQKISLAIARGNATSILSCFRSFSSFS